MCCDGTLFGRARLEPEEVALAKKNRLQIVANEGSFDQPCSALADGRCTVYEERPQACRKFVCRLHERLRIEGGDLEPYLVRVRRARELLVHLDESSEELIALMDADFARG